jgi:hypothetical protein
LLIRSKDPVRAFDPETGAVPGAPRQTAWDRRMEGRSQ